MVLEPEPDVAQKSFCLGSYLDVATSGFWLKGRKLKRLH